MKEKITSALFMVFLVFFLCLNLITKDTLISDSERRKLKQFPDINIKDIMDNSFMEEFDEYSTEQFVFRDIFRNIKANINYKLFRKLDNNGIYVIDDYIFKTEYPTNYESINNFINKLNKMEEYFTPDNKVYYSIIPDKNYYVNDSKYLNIDYDLIYKEMGNINYKYIDLRDVLTLEDYYKTDTHWKQENLEKVVNRLGKYMNFSIKHNYTKNYYEPFYGVYYGQSALKMDADKIIYLTNDIITNSNVSYLEDKNNNKVYTTDKFNNLDKYDVFLGGASSFIEISNPNSNEERELVIFRDSFGSSIAPLLISAYSKITIIDMRYITSNNYLELIEFTDQDILFLYSTLIVNNSGILKD